ncbi:MAG: class I SAM-dependent methyltransferase [Bacteroidia bacterium]|nr:class I SAM-dependent methyltransferase [Bacteroidia bacterium]
MQYDTIKRSLGNVVSHAPWMRVCFYHLLDLLLLRSWHIKRALNRWSKQTPNASILDAGSGFGQYSYGLSQLNSSYRILGVDVKDEQIADCNSFFSVLNLADRVRFESQDLTKYKVDNKYDLILSVDVMEHILEDELVFQNFYASMREGGMLLISTPSDLGGSDSDEHDANGAHGFIDEHVRDGYNINDIQEKLSRAGFKNINAKYSYGTFGHISWVLSMKWPITMLNFSKALFIVLPLYYILFFPWCLIFNTLDLYMHHKAGTGLIVEAYK